MGRGFSRSTLTGQEAPRRESATGRLLLLAGAARLARRGAVPGARAAAVPSRLWKRGLGPRDEFRSWTELLNVFNHD